MLLYSLYAVIISPKHGSASILRSNVFICRYMERVTSRKRKNRFGVTVRGDGGVTGEVRVLVAGVTASCH